MKPTLVFHTIDKQDEAGNTVITSMPGVERSGVLILSIKNNRVGSSRGWHVLGLGLVLAWMVTVYSMMGGWFELDGRVKELQTPLDNTDWIEHSEQWMGIYYKDMKFGYLYTRIEPAPSGVDLVENISLAVRLAGVRKQLNMSVKVRLSRSSMLESFDVLFDSDFTSARMRGRMDKDALIIEAQIADTKYSQRLVLETPPVVSLMLPKMLARNNLQSRQQYRVRLFDPLTLSTRLTIIEVTGIEALPAKDGLTPAFHLRRTLMDQQVDSWIDGRGVLLREEYPGMGLVFRKEEQATAIDSYEGLTIFEDRRDVENLVRMLLGGADD